MIMVRPELIMVGLCKPSRARLNRASGRVDGPIMSGHSRAGLNRVGGLEVHYATYLPSSERGLGSLLLRSVRLLQGLCEIPVILQPIPRPATRAEIASDKAQYSRAGEN
jgi:hypothetical protein